MVEAVQAVGNIVGGIAGYETGKYNKKADYAAATAEEQDGADQEARIRETARAAIGQQIAAQGESGFQQGTGSALDALTESQVNATLDALTARRKAAAAAQGRRTQGDVALAAGKNAMTQGFFGAAAAGVSASSDWASAKAGQTYSPSSATGDTVSVMSGYHGGYNGG